MNIKGKLVTIRAIEEDDLPALHKWGNDPDIWYMLGGWHFPSSFDSLQAWFAGVKNDKLNQRFVIEAEGKVIGTANLVSINWKDKNAEHGMLIGDKENRGKGYAQDCIMSIMRYAFEELGLNRLDTTIIEYNTPSLKVYVDKCGWVKEGMQRKWYFRKGRYWDRYVVGVTQEDYKNLIQKENYWGS
jgi:RimJ/RimL family protein N-acetyltransferase